MRPRIALRGIAAFAAALLLSIPSHAQLFRAYVSSTGSDSNPCTLPAPCRLLPAALTAVADGGEIWMLDSANYNSSTVGITKSVSILAIPGAVGSVVVTTGAPAISIATPGVKVSLRNLVITPVAGATGASGIIMTAGARLVMQRCVVANIPFSGISVSTPATVLLTDTIVRDGQTTGIFLSNGARATIARSVVSGHGSDGVAVVGIAAGTTTTVDISDSTLEGNAVAGLFAQSQNGTAVARATVINSSLARNFNGVELNGELGLVAVSIAHSSLSNNAATGLIVVGASAKATVSASVVPNNSTGLSQVNDGTLETAGNNSVRNNTGPNIGTITNVGTQ